MERSDFAADLLSEIEDLHVKVFDTLQIGKFVRHMLNEHFAEEVGRLVVFRDAKQAIEFEEIEMLLITLFSEQASQLVSVLINQLTYHL